MTLQEIKDAIHKGKSVYWGNTSYEVKLSKWDEYLVVCKYNGFCSPLEIKGKMDYKPEDFFSK